MTRPTEIWRAKRPRRRPHLRPGEAKEPREKRTGRPTAAARPKRPRPERDDLTSDSRRASPPSSRRRAKRKKLPSRFWKISACRSSSSPRTRTACARPLVQAALSDAVPVASGENLPQGRGAAQRQARRDFRAHRGRRQCARAAAHRRGAESPGGEASGAVGSRRPRHQRHGPARRPRPDGAEQAVRPGGAGRFGHQGASRRHVAIAGQ